MFKLRLQKCRLVSKALPTLSLQKAAFSNDLVANSKPNVVRAQRLQDKIHFNKNKFLNRRKPTTMEDDENSGKFPKVDEVQLTAPVSVRAFAELLGMRPKFLLRHCPVGFTIDDTLSLETMENISYALNVLPRRFVPTHLHEDVLPFKGKDDPSTAPRRPAVVTIMGHVDHGKTTLLDKLRHTNVAEKEFGGITQHIGAFEVKLSNGEVITFIDTPGHEAFTTMRAAGAQVTDIVIIVVAADDGVQQQTIEAIDHATNSGVRIIVAVNKIDKENANPEKVTRQLKTLGLIPESEGGDIPFVHISGLTGKGLDKLTEEIVLQAMDLNLCAKQTGCKAEATVIEARVDKGFGLSCSVIVKRGVMKPGKWMVAGMTYGRIKALRDYSLKQLDEALPSKPCEVVGLEDFPKVGDVLIEVEDQLTAKKIVEARLYAKQMADAEKRAARQEQETTEIAKKMRALEKEQNAGGLAAPRPTKPQEIKKAEEEKRKKLEELKEDKRIGLPIIIKADVQGTLDAFNEIISQFPTDTVYLIVINQSVGRISESDIEYAKSEKAHLLSMNSPVSEKIQKMARNAQVPLQAFRVIYHLIEYLKKELSKIIPVVVNEITLGEAQVKASFDYTLKEGAKKSLVKVAGCEVTKGIISTDASYFKVSRWNKDLLNNLSILSLNHFKDKVEEVKKGAECGIVLQGYDDIKADDVIVAVKKEIIQPTFDELIQRAAAKKKERSYRSGKI